MTNVESMDCTHFLSVYKSRGTLLPRTRARAVAAPRGKACRVTARTLRGPLKDLSRTKYSSQGPDKRSLSGRPTKAPARGAYREETRPRQEELAGKTTQDIPRKLAATRHAPRQDPASDKLPEATRRWPRQGACRGKLPLHARAPAHLLTCRSGTLPERTWREAVQLGVRGGKRR